MADFYAAPWPVFTPPLTGEAEERMVIDTLDQIYDYTDRLRATAARYADANA